MPPQAKGLYTQGASTTAGVAELADAQDLGWFQTRPRDELKALSSALMGPFCFSQA